MKQSRLFVLTVVSVILLSGCQIARRTTNTESNLPSGETSNPTTSNTQETSVTSNTSNTSVSETSGNSSTAITTGTSGNSSTIITTATSGNSSTTAQGTSSSTATHSSTSTLTTITSTLTPTTAPSEGDYYNSITSSMSGNTLKVALYNIIKGHTAYGYGGLEIAMKTTDRNWEKSPDPKDEDPEMYLLYLSDNENKPYKWSTSHGSYGSTVTGQYFWDKEHMWPKSNGFPAQSADAYSDLHHLRASDMKNNNSRSNLPYGPATGGSYVVDANGDNSGIKSSTSYLPQAKDRGDCARAIFYMATRYYNGDGSSGTSLTLTNGTDSSGGKWGYLSYLLDWNESDPPDEFEKQRNNLVQGIQGNRNPFIDHPEYARRIWG